MRAALIALFVLGCGGGEQQSHDADAIPCRSDCSSTRTTCNNVCYEEPSPGECLTGCAANELACKKVCESTFPGDDSFRCRSDCDSFGITCNNGCGADNTCRSACANKVQSCKLECYGLYGDQ